MRDVLHLQDGAVRSRRVPEEGLLDPEEFWDPDRSVYRLSGSFGFEVPEIRWKKSFTGDDIVLTAEIEPEILNGVRDVILTLHHDGMTGIAHFDGRLVSDHSYGKFLPWEISLRGFARQAGKLEIVCRGASRCETETSVRAERILRFR